jgi:cell filamentation protein
MALQTGLPFLDFRSMAGEGKRTYITAIQAGLDKDYAPMGRLFEQIIEESVRSS